MEVLDEINKLKLSPFVLLFFLTTGVINVSNSARGETTDPNFSAIPSSFETPKNDSVSEAAQEQSSKLTKIAEQLDEQLELSPEIPSLSQAPNLEPEESPTPQQQIDTAPDDKPEETEDNSEEDSQEKPDAEGETQKKPQQSPPQTPPVTPESPTPQTPTPQNPAPGTPTPETPAPQTPPTPPAPQVPAPETPNTPAPEIPTPDSEQQAEEARVLVAEVAVEGANQELTDLVYNTIRTRAGRTATRSQLQEDINAIYGTGYFANVRVTPEDTPLGVRVTFAVEQNPVLERVQIETLPKTEKARVLPDKVVQETFQGQYGEILNLRQLQEGIKKLNEWYSQNGYDLAQVIEAPKVSEDGVVTLIIAEGVIDNIRVRFFDDEDSPTKGKTRDFIITREMELKPGDVFNRNTAQRDLRRVFGLGILEDARLSFSPGEDPRKVVVNVDVVEGNTGSLAAGAGFSSNSGLFGTVSYQEQNLGGNNQTLGAEIQLGEREFLFDVSFTDPWIATDDNRLSYTINGFRRRSISLVFDGDDSRLVTENGEDSPRVVRTGGGITFSRPLAKDPYTKPDWRLTAGFNYQHVQIENSDGDISPRSSEDDGLQNLAISDSGEDDLFTFSFGATRDRRNNAQQPTSGSILRLGMEQTAPFGSGSILFNRVRASYSYYIPIDFINFGFTDEKLPQALAFNVQAGTVLGDLPPYEAFVIGGSNSVRGYGEGELGSGRSYVQLSAEYRFPILSFLGAAVFVDAGSTIGSGDGVPGNPEGVRDLPGSGFGYGIGVRVQSPVGPIRIDYGINDQGDSRIHFGIGERF